MRFKCNIFGLVSETMVACLMLERSCARDEWKEIVVNTVFLMFGCPWITMPGMVGPVLLVKGKWRLAGRVCEKGPGREWLSARGVGGRCPSPIWRGTRGVAGCGTLEVGQDSDVDQLVVNGMEWISYLLSVLTAVDYGLTSSEKFPRNCHKFSWHVIKSLTSLPKRLY